MSISNNNDPYQRCGDHVLERNTEKVYTADGKSYCCNYLPRTPQDVASNDQYTKLIHPILQDYLTYAKADCKGKQIVDKQEFSLFDQLYYLPAMKNNKNTSNLVPIYSTDSVSCSAAGTNFIPMVLEYKEEDENSSRFIRFCTENPANIENDIKNLGLVYNLYNYETKQGDKCNSNTCNTPYIAAMGQSLHPNISQSSSKNNQVMLVTISIGVAVLILTIIILVSLHKEQSKRSN